uniref:Uncharacterized protein n=1 Tax=Grammatophora oceanica TaxID=210454 RepID=A0A7S1Y1R7_9STRA|mmetsp:Transcript_15841/g.23357  ORF Transcript_15841/g.23357 Transcript_15841/m.23357 type:complete len:119 (+) Transcript_15841:617-973(+)
MSLDHDCSATVSWDASISWRLSSFRCTLLASLLQRRCSSRNIKPRVLIQLLKPRGMLRYTTNEHAIGTQDVDCNDVYETKLFYSYVRKKCTRKDLVDAGPGDQIPPGRHATIVSISLS